MLEIDYPTRYRELIQSVDWDIELPVEWSSFFDEKGEVNSFAEDQRSNKRLKVRTHGLLHFEESLPFVSRPAEFVGTYTRDFSRQGCGFLVSFEVFPEERVRIVLPTLWMQLLVVRTRRITSKCYEIGGQLLHRYDPAPEAFRVDAEPQIASV